MRLKYGRLGSYRETLVRKEDGWEGGRDFGGVVCPCIEDI